MLKYFFSLVMSLTFISLLSFNVQTVNADSDFSHSQEQMLEEQKQIYKNELKNLTLDEIIFNFERIQKEYKVGEVFSLKDQVFIEMYADKPNSFGVTLYKAHSVFGTKTVNGITVKVEGTIKDDIQNLLKQSFGAYNLRTNTTAGANKVSSVKTVVHHDAYGLIGSSGIGKVYTGSISTSGLNTVFTATERYTGIVAYAATWCTVTVNHSGGTFTINPN